MKLNKEVTRCFECKEWIGFLDDAIGVEIGRLGENWGDGHPFITYSKDGKSEERFYHKSCYREEEEK